MLQNFFRRLGKTPDKVTSQDVFAFADGQVSTIPRWCVCAVDLRDLNRASRSRHVSGTSYSTTSRSNLIELLWKICFGSDMNSKGDEERCWVRRFVNRPYPETRRILDPPNDAVSSLDVSGEPNGLLVKLMRAH